MKHYSKPLSLYEIDLLHYTSVGSDKEYFVDTLILKALDKDGKNIYKEQDKKNLLKRSKSELESMYFEMFECIFDCFFAYIPHVKSRNIKKNIVDS